MACEDGTGVAGADCYIEADYVTTYLDSTGRADAWSEATDSDRHYAIVQATAWLDMNYGHRYVGYKMTSTQGLEFPRSLAFDRYGNTITGVPEMLKRAVAEMSERALVAPDTLSADVDAGGNVASETTTVGSITISKAYSGSKDGQKRFPVVDRLLRQGGLIDAGGWAQR